MMTPDSVTISSRLSDVTARARRDEMQRDAARGVGYPKVSFSAPRWPRHRSWKKFLAVTGMRSLALPEGHSRGLPQRCAEWLCPSAFLNIPQDSGPGGTLSRSPAASRSSLVLQSGGEVVRVAIMQAFQVIRKAVLALHRWFMKYSGMTMIIDNVEERRRWRKNQGRLEEASDSSTERDSPSQE